MKQFLKSNLAPGDWRQYTSRKFSTRTTKSDRHPDCCSFFELVALSRPVRRNSLNATWRLYTEYTSWSLHNTLLLVITWLRNPWFEIMLCLRRSHSRSHAHFHPVFDVVTQRQVCSFSVTALVSTSFPNRTRSWCNSPDAPARWSESGRMADSVPNTKSNGCKSKATRMALSLVFNGTTFSVCSSVLHSSRLVMSLLNVPYRPFLRVLSSPSPPSSRPSASSTSIARSRCSSPSAPARWSESGRMADSAQTQVMCPSLPTSPATRIWSTRRPSSPIANKSSCAQTTSPWSPPVQKA